MSTLSLTRLPGQWLRVRVGEVDVWICYEGRDPRRLAEARITIVAPRSAAIHRGEHLPAGSLPPPRPIPTPLACTRAAYATHEAAGEHIADLCRTGRARNEGLHSYDCPACGRVHIRSRRREAG